MGSLKEGTTGSLSFIPYPLRQSRNPRIRPSLSRSPHRFLGFECSTIQARTPCVTLRRLSSLPSNLSRALPLPEVYPAPMSPVSPSEATLSPIYDISKDWVVSSRTTPLGFSIVINSSPDIDQRKRKAIRRARAPGYSETNFMGNFFIALLTFRGMDLLRFPLYLVMILQVLLLVSANSQIFREEPAATPLPPEAAPFSRLNG